MAPQPDSESVAWTGRRIGVGVRLLCIGAMTVMAATMPAAAFVDELGNAIGNAGGEPLADLFWFALLLAVMYVGSGRLIKAGKDCGSVHKEERRQGHEEVVPAAFTFFGGIVLVLAFGTFVAQIFPASWSWIGVDLLEYINLPFGGGGGSDNGSAAQSISDPGTIYSPELSEALAELSHNVIHAPDIVMVLV